MQANINQGQSENITVSAVLADGVTPSTVTLSGLTFSSTDTTVFTVAPDPTNSAGAILTSVGAGAATLFCNGTATETDGATEFINGALSVTVEASGAGAGPAASLVFQLGTPYTTGSTPIPVSGSGVAAGSQLQSAVKRAVPVPTITRK